MASDSPTTSAARHRWHPVQNNGWWCCVCDNRCHKDHPCADHAPCVPVPKDRETVGMVCQTCGTNYAQMGRRHDCSDCTHPADGWHLHIVRRNDRVIWRCSEGNRSMTVDPGDRITYEYAQNGATMGCPL